MIKISNYLKDFPIQERLSIYFASSEGEWKLFLMLFYCCTEKENND